MEGGDKVGEQMDSSSAVLWAQLPAELLVHICRLSAPPPLVSGPKCTAGSGGSARSPQFCWPLISSMRSTCKHWSASLAAATTTLSPRSMDSAPPGWDLKFSNITTFILRSTAPAKTSTQRHAVHEGQMYTPSPVMLSAEFNLKSVCSLSRLSVISLSHFHSLSDQGIATVGKSAGLLTSLDISYCYRVTNAGLAALGNLKLLKHADMSGLYSMTDQGLRSGLRQSINLECLKLNDCTLLSDDAMSFLEELPALRKLSLRGCIQLSDPAMAHLQSLQSLENLDLSMCCGLTPKGLRPLSVLPSLDSLLLSRVMWMDRHAIPELSALHHLTCLDLSSCINVDDDAVAAVANLKLKDLQEINLERCHRITDSGVSNLHLLPSLRHLNVLSCEKVTLQACRNLQQFCKSLVLVEVHVDPTGDLSTELAPYVL